MILLSEFRPLRNLMCSVDNGTDNAHERRRGFNAPTRNELRNLDNW